MFDFLLATAILTADPDVGLVTFCDTPDQIRQYIERVFVDRDVQAALGAVNKDAGKLACGYQAIAFIRKQTADRIATSEGLIEIVEIEVIGARTNDRWVEIDHDRQFIPVWVKNEGI